MTIIETILLILVAFAFPIPIWLVILHTILATLKGKIRTITYLSLGLFWLLSFVLVFSNKQTILNYKFETNFIFQFLAIAFLVIAIIIDILTVHILGYRRLSCFAEMKGNSNNQLVTSGIYKYARHPRYVEYILLSLFFGFWFGIYFFLIFAIYLLIAFSIAIIFEERELIKRFGNEYMEYSKKVPRFFIKLK